MMESCANLVFLFFLSSILFDYSNLFFDICISFFLRPIKMAKKNSHQWAWRRLVGWMLSLAEGWLTELRWAWPSKLGKGRPGVQLQKQDRYLREEIAG